MSSKAARKALESIQDAIHELREAEETLQAWEEADSHDQYTIQLVREFVEERTDVNNPGGVFWDLIGLLNRRKAEREP